ncbi:unnamed protein product [Prunus armeniaca]|uniref:Uncharacterized protein n=1 Tax=Prunus armeniaca TaxID=36596 RepID=A0A6J5W469_PRUAR|nr:unnamed protein product [Prunus armeniaca]CAB4294772.1 unnamed protein product [Prunus armeniaca]
MPPRKVLLQRAAGKAGEIAGSRSLWRKCRKIGGKGLVTWNVGVSSREFVGVMVGENHARAASTSVLNVLSVLTLLGTRLLFLQRLLHTRFKSYRCKIPKIRVFPPLLLFS